MFTKTKTRKNWIHLWFKKYIYPWIHHFIICTVHRCLQTNIHWKSNPISNTFNIRTFFATTTQKNRPFRFDYVQRNMNTRIMLPQNPRSSQNIYRQHAVNLQQDISSNLQQNLNQNLNQTVHLKNKNPNSHQSSILQQHLNHDLQQNSPQISVKQGVGPNFQNHNFGTQKTGFSAQSSSLQMSRSNSSLNSHQALQNLQSFQNSNMQFRKFQNQQTDVQQQQRQLSATTRNSGMPLNLQQPQLVYSKCARVWFGKCQTVWKVSLVMFFHWKFGLNLLFIPKLRPASKRFKKSCKAASRIFK